MRLDGVHDIALREFRLVRMGKSPEAYPHLKRIYPRIEVGKRGIRNVHETKLRVEIIFASQKVQTQRAASGEIHTRSAGRHIIIREKCAASEFEVGNNLARLCEIPFQREGIQPEAISVVIFLDHQEDGYYIHSEFELAAQKARADRSSQNPAVSWTHIPDSGGCGTPIQSMAATRPYLQIMPAIHWASLGL